ncbi:MAG: hypothetical protein HOP11_12670 [Saprospiraceae bacterium]|nr:hypothetical protein [Saprospiraceae bacterium]
MLYPVFRVIMRFTFSSYFKKIKIYGAENIPDSGPVLFLSNHPCSFTEPMLLACYQPRILNFLVRGDIFENKFLKPILEGTHQIPIYRARDGFENLRKNKSTFDLVFQKLDRNETVLIFPESTTKCVRFLRPLQKGAAHIAIGAAVDHGLKDLLVIPCGVNFNNVLKAGEDANILIGEPIPIIQWIYNQTEGADLPTEITKLFTSEMNKVVLSVPSDISPEFYDQLSLFTFDKNDSQAERLQKHNQLISGIQNHKKTLESSLMEFAGKNVKVESRLFLIDESFFKKIFTVINSVFNFILGIPALIIFSLPLLLCRNFSNTIIKSLEYKPPLRLIFSILMILIILLLTCIVLSINFSIWVGVLSIPVLLISLTFFLRFIYHLPELKLLFNIFSNQEKFIAIKSKIQKLILSEK